MHIRSHFLFKPFKGFPAQINENPKSLLCSLRSYVIFSYLLFEFLNYNSFLKSFCSSHTGIITAFQTHKVVFFSGPIYYFYLYIFSWFAPLLHSDLWSDTFFLKGLFYSIKSHQYLLLFCTSLYAFFFF